MNVFSHFYLGVYCDIQQNLVLTNPNSSFKHSKILNVGAVIIGSKIHEIHQKVVPGVKPLRFLRRACLFPAQLLTLQWGNLTNIFVRSGIGC